MSSFFTVPTYSVPGVPPGRLLAFGAPGVPPALRSVSCIAADTNPDNSTTTPYAIADVPWGTSVSAGNTTGDILQSQVDAVQADIDANNASLADAQTTLAAAQAAVSAARSTLADAQAAVPAAEDAKDAARMEIWRAHIQEQTAALRNDAVLEAAASARLTAAWTAYTSAAAAYQTATQTANTAQTALTTALVAQSTAQAAWQSYEDAVYGLNLELTLITLNKAAADQADPDPTHPVYGVIYAYYAGGLATYASSVSTISGHSYQGAHQGGSITGTYYARIDTDCEYRFSLPITDAQYQALQGYSYEINWCEVTVTYGIKKADLGGGEILPATTPPTYTPAYTECSADLSVEPTYSHVVKSTTLAVADAVQDPATGGWTLTSGTYDIPAPGCDDGGNVSVYVGGLPQLPTVALTTDGDASVRQRQGWDEFTTSSDAAYSRRYLTLTASPTADAPAGNAYNGTQEFIADPSGGNALAFQTTMSASASAAAPHLAGGNGTAPPPADENAVILSPTQRVMTTPVGLQFDLSDEQTPDSIQSAALDDVSDLDGTARTGSTVPNLPGPPPAGGCWSLRYFSPDGNFAVVAHRRYKLVCQENDYRLLPATVWTVTLKWIVRTTDLDTGKVDDEPGSQTVTITGGTATTAATYDLGTDWIDLPVPGANQRVEIIPQPGVNDDPHTFSGVVATLVAPADADGGG